MITSLAGNILRLTAEELIFVPLIFITLYALPAPYYAFKLIRRNRCLGRDIYRELALADRFMEVWNCKKTLGSGQQQYIFAFVTNGNRAAAQLMQIDSKLAEWNLVKRNSVNGTFNGPSSIVSAKRGWFLLRNWLIFLMLLWFKVAIFGDKFSHITSGSGKYNEKNLKRMYYETWIVIVSFMSLIACILIKL